MSTSTTPTKTLSPNAATYIGGALALILAAGYVVLLSLKIVVPATYTVVLVAVVTHFLGVVVPNSITNSQIVASIERAVGLLPSPSQQTPPQSKTTTTTTTELAKSSVVSSPPPVIQPGASSASSN